MIQTQTVKTGQILAEKIVSMLFNRELDNG
jgi:hypothetical protein